jgi:heme/copper-type cytochrome/quinol oxidase subunit 4
LVTKADDTLHVVMYVLSIPSILVGLALLVSAKRWVKHWFPISILGLQLVCSTSFLILTIMHSADMDEDHRAAFQALFQIFVNLIFIGMSAEFLVAF